MLTMQEATDFLEANVGQNLGRWNNRYAEIRRMIRIFNLPYHLINYEGEGFVIRR